MTIKVKFFASLREALPGAIDSIDASGIETITDVWNAATDGQAMPDHVLCSVNLEPVSYTHLTLPTIYSV